jgi:hypothetical protein
MASVGVVAVWAALDAAAPDKQSRPNGARTCDDAEKDEEDDHRDTSLSDAMCFMTQA